MNDKTKKRYKYEFETALNSGKTLEEFIKSRKNKHEISKIKNGIKHSPMSQNQKDEYTKLCEETNKIKPKYHKRPEEQFKLRKTLNNINLLKSKRLKLSFRFQLISGLRVEELSNLTLKDITMKNNKIYVFVEKGKGNKSRKVECLDDQYVVDNLLKLKPKKDGKIFCSTDYIMRKAKEINFHSHDLRKTFGVINYYSDESDEQTAVKNLQDKLGHAYNTSTYKKYKGRDINLNNTKWDIFKNK